MSRFLRFIVERTLEGRTDEVKETTIGVAVFDRDPVYDPKTDPVVRNEARRLRGKLEQYYSADGANDRLRIALPKGGYVPSFEWIKREAVAPPAPPKIAEVVTAGPVGSPSAGEKLRWRWYLLAALGGMLLASILYSLIHRSPSQAPVSPSVSLSPLTTYAGQKLQPAISPDGSQIAFVWDGANGNYDIYRKRLNGPAVRLTTDPAHDLRPAWSPNGKQIAFLRLSRTALSLIVIGSQGGPEHELRKLHPINWQAIPASTAMWPGLAWSHDGRSLIVTDQADGEPGRPLYLVSVLSGEARRLTNPGTSESDIDVAPSPDGRQLAFVRNFSNAADEIFVMPAGGEPRPVVADRKDVRGLSWTPDNRRIVFSSNRSGSYGLWIVAPDEGQPPRLIPTAGESATDPSVSPDGKWIAYTDSWLNANIWRNAIGGVGTGEKLISSSRQDNSAQYSPDGRRIAFVSNRSGSWEIWTAQADGSMATDVTNFRGSMVGTPRWSPDGTTLVFDARPEGHSSIYVMQPGEPPRLLEKNRFENKRPGWSRDGKWIYFNSNRGGSPQLWKIQATGGPAEIVCDCRGYDEEESFDGETLFFLDSDLHIWQLPARGGRPGPVPGLERALPSRVWSVARGGIYFANENFSARTIQFYSFATHRIAVVAHTSADILFGFPNLSVSPDGRWLLYAQRDEMRSDLMQARGVF